MLVIFWSDPPFQISWWNNGWYYNLNNYYKCFGDTYICNNYKCLSIVVVVVVAVVVVVVVYYYYYYCYYYYYYRLTIVIMCIYIYILNEIISCCSISALKKHVARRRVFVALFEKTCRQETCVIKTCSHFLFGTLDWVICWSDPPFRIPLWGTVTFCPFSRRRREATEEDRRRALCKGVEGIETSYCYRKME